MGEIEVTTVPRAVDFQLLSFSPLDRTPSIRWYNLPGTTSYRLTVQDTKTQEQIYQQAFPGTPLVDDVNPAIDRVGESVHQLMTELRDGTYSIHMDAAYENGTTSFPSELVGFIIGDRPEFDAATRRGIGTRGTFSWGEVPGATEYRVWINEVDQNGNSLASLVLHESVTDPRFEIPTRLNAGTYRTWVQAVLREGDGQIHRSAWNSSLVTQLAAPPATFDVSEWKAIEYQVGQSDFDWPFIAGDLPAYTLRIGPDRPVRYTVSNRPLPIPTPK